MERFGPESSTLISIWGKNWQSYVSSAVHTTATLDADGFLTSRRLKSAGEDGWEEVAATRVVPPVRGDIPPGEGTRLHRIKVAFARLFDPGGRKPPINGGLSGSFAGSVASA